MPLRIDIERSPFTLSHLQVQGVEGDVLVKVLGFIIKIFFIKKTHTHTLTYSLSDNEYTG